MRSDAQLVTAARADDGDAFAELYDRYADRVHAFCYGRLRTDAAAADALQETFLRAHGRLSEIGDPARFRPWVFAIARNAVVDLARARGRQERRRDWGPGGGRRRPTVPHPHEGDPEEPGAGPRLIAEESAELLWVAATALLPRDQELVELHLREGLEGSDLALAMEVEPARLHVMVKRMTTRLSSAVGSLLVARVGRQQCSDLDALLVDWNGTYSLAIRSTITRHVEACDTCHTTLGAAISWTTIAAAMPAPPAPTAVRVAVLAVVSGHALGGTSAAAEVLAPGSNQQGADGPGVGVAEEGAALTAGIAQEPDTNELGPTDAITTESSGAIGTVLLYLALAVILGAGVLAWIALRDDDADVVATDVAGASETAGIGGDGASGDNGPGGITTAAATATTLAGTQRSTLDTAPAGATGPPSATTPGGAPFGPISPPTSSRTAPTTSSRAGSSTSLPSTTATTPQTTAPTTSTNTTSTAPTSTAPTTTNTTTTTTTIPPRPAQFSGSTDPIGFAPGTGSVSYTFANIGGLPLSWTASTVGPFEIDTPQGTLLPDSSITVALTFDTGLPAGDYAGLLRLDTDGDGNPDIDIVLSATVPTPSVPALP